MKRILSSLFLLFLIIFFSPVSSDDIFDASTTRQAQLKEQMCGTVDNIKNIFSSSYAPANWKKQHFNWDLKSEIEKVKNKINTTENISLKEFHRYVKDFFNSTRDYHVSVRFSSTEAASLPFHVKKASERYFFVYIDREKLPMSSFPFFLGDELVSFDGKPIEAAIQEIKLIARGDVGRDNSDSNPKTDQALAEIFLTHRSGSKFGHGTSIPKGPIDLIIKPGFSDEEQHWQLAWDYHPEKISDNTALRKGLWSSPVVEDSRMDRIKKFFQKKMVVNCIDRERIVASNSSSDPHIYGARKGFLPHLGTVIWESEDDSPYQAYIFQTFDKKLIGYLRIPDYSAGDTGASCTPYAFKFADILNRLNTCTEALVLDQTNNPGGFGLFNNALVSMFSDQPLYAPKMRMMIDQNEVLEAIEILEYLEDVDNDDEAKESFGDYLLGVAVDYEFVQFARNYCRFIIDEWDSGKTLSAPYHYFGTDKILPCNYGNYSHPVLLLINELDFSCGDFFPAIFQDNKLGTILGVQTSGAGGYVYGHNLQNNLGIENFHYTSSLAERIDNNPIENLGVKPDIEYVLTAFDLQFNYAGYKAKILSTIDELIKEENQ